MIDAIKQDVQRYLKEMEEKSKSNGKSRRKDKQNMQEMKKNPKERKECQQKILQTDEDNNSNSYKPEN